MSNMYNDDIRNYGFWIVFTDDIRRADRLRNLKVSYTFRLKGIKDKIEKEWVCLGDSEAGGLHYFYFFSLKDLPRGGAIVSYKENDSEMYFIKLISHTKGDLEKLVKGFELTFKDEIIQST